MTFSRVIRIVALLLVVIAAWRARPPAEAVRVALLILPGTPAEALAPEPAIAAGPIATDEGLRTGSAFWTRLLALAEMPGREPAEQPALWDGDAGEVRTFGGVQRLFRRPGSVSAFSGGSGGVLVEEADLASGRIPPPYDRAIEAVTSVAAVLGRDQWSEWLRVSPAPQGSGQPDPLPAEFQFARVGDSSWFFSPAYVVGVGDEAGEPFLRGADGELRPLLAAHVMQLWQKRAQRLQESVGSPGDRRPLLVFDGLGQDLVSVFAPDFVPAALAAQRDASIAAVLATLRRAVGPAGAVLVVGGPSTGRAFVPAWYRLCDGSGAPAVDAMAVAPLVRDFASMRALVRYLTGVVPESAERQRVPAELVARFPVSPRIVRPSPVATPSSPASTPWSASGLQSLPGAVASGR